MFGPGYRLYFGKDGKAMIVLLCGGTKHSQTRDSLARKSAGRHIEGERDMTRRSSDWNAGLAQDLQDAAFAREFLLAASEEGISVQVALGKVVRAMGVREFAAKVHMASPNVLRALNPRHNPTQQTLNRLLKPFGLKLSLTPLARPRRSHAA